MSEEEVSKTKKADIIKKIALRFLLILLISIIIGALLLAFAMTVFKKDTGDSEFKDNKKEWEELTENFKTDE